MKRYLFLFCCLLLGLASAGAVYTYPSIPYAHSERFGAPIVADGVALPADVMLADSGVVVRKVAYQRAYTSDQPTTESHYVLPQHAEYQMTEDCQVLTVNTPFAYGAVGTEEQRLPVLVYIHGGNYFAGGGEKPNTQLAELAERGQVVTVSITYRLGIFGYYYDPAIATPNCGLLDQLAALEWVKRYIGLFGGDAENITLAGQSAGAQSVVYCLADTNRVSLRRAVVFSAPMGLTTSAATARKRTRWVEDYFASHYGEAYDVRTCPADTLLAVQLRYQEAHPQAWHSLPFSPTALPQKPCYGDKVRWPEQVVVCAQEDDGSMFGPKALWPMLTSVVFTTPAKSYVRYLQRQGVDAQYHLFRWKPTGSPLGAAHCCELPLLLGTSDEWVGTWIMGTVSKEELEVRRRQAMDDFAHFMRTGEWQME
ncbi:MAG: carboxylesterase family protein [Paludibacteraceae bacterium]